MAGNDATLSAALAAEQTARANEDEALAQDIVTAQATLGDDITAAVQVETQARALADGTIEAKNTIKVDLAGHVSGYGLIASANVDTARSLSSVFGQMLFGSHLLQTLVEQPRQAIFLKATFG